MKMQLPFKTAALCVAVFASAAAIRASADDATTYNGVLATPAVALRASIVVGGSGLTRSLAIEEQGVRTGARVRSFDVDMQKRMHLIVVSDDLSEFMHIHPTLDSAGTFRITTTFPGPGVYHLYADAVPEGFGHAVFRFDVPVGEAQTATTSSRRFSPIDVATVGDYVVRLNTDRVKASADTPVLISIMKHGEPASDLHPYLGAYAHVVAIGTADLSYTHIHAMDMDTMMSTQPMGSGAGLPASASVPATMPVHVTLPHPGLYKVWVQFIGGSRVYAAPFVLSAS